MNIYRSRIYNFKIIGGRQKIKSHEQQTIRVKTTLKFWKINVERNVLEMLEEKNVNRLYYFPRRSLAHDKIALCVCIYTRRFSVEKKTRVVRILNILITHTYERRLD